MAREDRDWSRVRALATFVAAASGSKELLDSALTLGLPADTKPKKQEPKDGSYERLMSLFGA